MERVLLTKEELVKAEVEVLQECLKEMEEKGMDKDMLISMMLAYTVYGSMLCAKLFNKEGK